MRPALLAVALAIVVAAAVAYDLAEDRCTLPERLVATE
jgi:hypothetical protein